jgi:dephospho-CoA kinase
VLVYTPREYRIERLDQRGMTLPSILDREQRQIPDEEKLNKVDLVVANTGSALALKEKAGELVRSLRDIPYRQLKSFV